jgi:hypothetical protein
METKIRVGRGGTAKRAPLSQNQGWKKHNGHWSANARQMGALHRF